jgi:hypothetical protein
MSKGVKKRRATPEEEDGKGNGTRRGDWGTSLLRFEPGIAFIGDEANIVEGCGDK